jgi:hypothetical protein
MPLDKVAATLAAIPLIAAETGLNAEHLADVEGWMSTLVAGAIGATLAAAAALPIAERAMTKGYWLKASGLTAFFLIMMAFSFTTSVGRVGAQGRQRCRRRAWAQRPPRAREPGLRSRPGNAGSRMQERTRTALPGRREGRRGFQDRPAGGAGGEG